MSRRSHRAFVLEIVESRCLFSVGGPIELPAIDPSAGAATRMYATEAQDPVGSKQTRPVAQPELHAADPYLSPFINFSAASVDVT